MQIANRCAPCKIASGAENFVLQALVASIVFNITPWHGPHGKHRLSIVRNAYLLARYLAMDIRKPHRKHFLRPGSIIACAYFGRYLEMGLHITVLSVRYHCFYDELIL
jgi:hypothetical protein